MSETANLNTAPDAEPDSKPLSLDIQQIQAILPHRYPFLLIDRVVEIERKKKIVAIKNVTANEPFFTGHFPGNPIMPGVLIVEAMAQAGATLLLLEMQARDNKLVVFTGIERARFRRPVVPGDQLRIEVEVLAWRNTAGRMGGKVLVDGKLVAEATISCAVVGRPDQPGARAGDSPTAGDSPEASDSSQE
jgi:3-hydroxyacyl-[acyl-carrier-protein] dehydratase